ncbi:hypothetical protein DFH06DRAFT_1334352 [Mycena polygramma]|nr:hypothetical protein DFH06DRAFT_1334352 [Mycena polygramma]
MSPSCSVVGVSYLGSDQARSGVLFPVEIMRFVFVLVLPSCGSSGAGHLGFKFSRGRLALVCRYWAAVVYGDTSLWSSITVTGRTSLHALRRAVELSADRSLSVKLSFESFSAKRSFTSAAERIAEFFVVLSPTSSRWSSFVFSCQHPVIFGCVSAHCATLVTPLLTSMTLLYWYLPGYARMRGDTSVREPYIPGTWFSRAPICIQRLELNGVPLFWDTLCLFRQLRVVDFSDFPPDASLDWEVFSALFASATKLEILRIGNLHTAFLVPPQTLRSASLEELDVRFVGSPDIGLLVQHMDLPVLKSLVVRGFYQMDLESVLLWNHLVPRITRLEVRGWLGQAETVWPLFDMLVKLEELDLTHARGEIFRSFYDWSSARITGLGSFESGLIRRFACLSDMSVFVPALPAEMWMAIFTVVCFQADQTSAEFIRVRGRISLVLLLDHRSSPAGTRACVLNSKELPLSIDISHVEFHDTSAAPSRVANFRTCLELLKPASQRWAALHLRANWSPTFSELMLVLGSASAESLQYLTLSCSAFVAEGTIDAIHTTPLSIFGANFPSLKRLDVSGVPLRWSDPHRFDQLTHLSLRNLPVIACPTLEQYAALFMAAPRLETLILKGVGCETVPDTHRPLPLTSVVHLEIIFGVGPYTESSRFYNLLKAFSFPRLASLSVAFLTVPSVHAFVELPMFARCGSVRIVGRICCGEWLVHLYLNMPNVVNLDVRGAASGFLAALSGPLPTTTIFPCSRLRSLVVSSNQWKHLRRIVEARIKAGCPLEFIGYESQYREDEDSVDRNNLDDYLVVKAKVKRIHWIPAQPSKEPMLVSL